jgi:hypothetical protein
MRTPLALDDELLADAEFYTGMREKSALARQRRSRRWSSARPCGGWPVSGAPNRISRSPSATFGTQVILVDTSVWIEGL